MFKRKWIAGAVFAGLFTISSAAQERVFFIEPKDGATVTNPVQMKFGLEGMTIADAGMMKDGTGHHHVLVDSGPLPKGEIIPMDDKSLHFGKGQTQAEITLPPGEHTLTLQFGDGAHRSYGPQMSQTIKVRVK